MRLRSGLQFNPLSSGEIATIGTTILNSRNEDLNLHPAPRALFAVGILSVVLASCAPIARKGGGTDTLESVVSLSGQVDAPESGEANKLESVVSLIGQVDDSAFQLDLLKGIADGLRGQRSVPMPRSWPVLYAKLSRSSNPDVQALARQLALKFGDPQALRELRQVLTNQEAKLKDRESALKALLARKDTELPSMLLQLLAEPALRRAAVRGLAVYDHKETPKAILRHYADMPAAERLDAVQTLVSRPDWALALLNAVAKREVSRTDLSAFAVRQMIGLGDARVKARVEEVWGVVRAVSRDKKELFARYKKLLTPRRVKTASRSSGRAIFARTCGACHQLFGEGGIIAPDLTGSNRADLDYLLTNVLDPNETIGRAYQLAIVNTRDGRVVVGMIQAENERALTIQSINEQVVLPRAEVTKITILPKSMMPEGLFQTLKDQEVADLVSYLASPRQVPLPGNALSGSEKK